MNRHQRRKSAVIAKTSAIQSPQKRKAQQQKTLDHMDRVEEQDSKYGQRRANARVAKLDNKPLTELAGPQLLKKVAAHDMCKTISIMARCTLEESAERIVSLLLDGSMLCGWVNGKFEIGLSHQGLTAFSQMRR